MATNFVFSPLQYQHLDHQPPISPTLIADYKTAHEQMLAAIEALDELTHSAAPAALRVSSARLRITRASFEWRATLQRLQTALCQRPSPAVTRALGKVEQLHLELREAHMSHASEWPPERIGSDWAAYCQSNAQVRRCWCQAIERERTLIYPLL